MSMKKYYERGGVVIYNARAEEVVPGLEAVDLLLTDPPFGGGYAGDPVCGKGNVRGVDHHRNQWDDQPVDGLVPLLLSASRHQVIWGGNYYALPPSRGWLIWHKPDAPPIMASAELAWTSRDMNTRYISHTIAATNAERIGHPTQKPLRVISWCLSFFPEAASVLDPFCGSGTTLLAAAKRGLRCVGIDELEWCAELSARRLDTFFNQPDLFTPPVEAAKSTQLAMEAL